MLQMRDIIPHVLYFSLLTGNVNGLYVIQYKYHIISARSYFHRIYPSWFTPYGIVVDLFFLHRINVSCLCLFFSLILFVVFPFCIPFNTMFKFDLVKQYFPATKKNVSLLLLLLLIFNSFLNHSFLVN